MTDTEHRPAPDLLAELRGIDGQLDRLFARRAWVVDRLEAGRRGALGETAPPAATPGDSVQRVLLGTGAGLLGLAGMFFAAVAWTLVGPLGRFTILLVVGAGLGAAASWVRPRLVGAAGALAAVAATLVTTAGYAAPALWQVTWSATALAGYAGAVSAVLSAAYAVAALTSGIRSWTVAAALTASVGVVAAGTAVALATADPLGYTAATAVLSLAVAAAGAYVRARRAWWAVLTVAAVTSVLSLLAWTVETERVVPYALALLGWATLCLVGGRLVPATPAVVAHTAGAVLAAGATCLLVGTLPLGVPNLPLAALGTLLVVAVAHTRVLPAWPGTAAAAVLGAGAVMVPTVDGASAGDGHWAAYLCLVAVATAAAGWSPRPLGTAQRGLLWWSAGTAAGLAWLVHLGDDLLTGPVERVAVPVGALLVLAGAGWATSVRRSAGPWLPTAAWMLPGLLVALLPGSLASWSLSWDAGLSDALVRTVGYTLLGAVLAALGARLRTAAVLVAGEVIVVVCVLAHLSAAIQQVPQWVALATAGALLLGVGARWEWLRGRGTAAAVWVGRLR